MKLLVMPHHDDLVYRMTEYFDLCDLATAWREDRETTLDIAGRERTFSTKAQVERFRDGLERDLRGYCNVLRSEA